MKNVTRLLIVFGVLFAAATTSRQAKAEFMYPAYGNNFNLGLNYGSYGGYPGYYPQYPGGYNPYVTQTTVTGFEMHSVQPGYGYGTPCGGYPCQQPIMPMPCPIVRPIFMRRPCGFRRWFNLGIALGGFRPRGGGGFFGLNLAFGKAGYW